jgi:site-specific DNA recombinase
MQVAIYARFSSDMQSKRSCEDQIRECQQYAKRQGWVVVLIEHDDAKRAGALAARDGYGRLMKAAEQRAFDILLVFEMARFSRNFLGGMVELASLAEHGVKIADTLIGAIDLDTPHGQMMASVHLMGAHQDVKKLSVNSKRGLRGQVMEKFSSGGRPAYGLRRVPVYSETERDVDGRAKRRGVRIEPDPATAATVVRIFTLYAKGASKREIARLLNAERIPSRGAGGFYAGRANSGTWSTTSIKTMLENRIYVGHREWNRWSRTGKKLANGRNAIRRNSEEHWDHVPEYCAPVVDELLWADVQQRLADDHIEYKKTGNASKGRKYLLSGMVSCLQCGRSFVIGGYRKGEPHYRCSMAASRGRDVCSNTSCLPVAALETRVKHVLDSVAKDPQRLADLVSTHNHEVDRHNREQSERARRLEAELLEVNTALSRLVGAIESGAASSTVMEAIQRRESEAATLRGAIEQARAQLQPRIEPRVSIEDYRRGPKSLFTGEILNDKALVAEALSTIEVARDGGLALVFRPDSMFRLTRWEVAPGRPAIMHSVQELRAVLEIHHRISGAPARAAERDGRIILRDDSTSRVCDPNGN